ncbi:MAG: hypothetical protein HGA96_10250 [Desulfobulbaceae bacterium]|nr:hypothetical protein [Desulfobulbaceae bacterium]
MPDYFSEIYYNQPVMNLRELLLTAICLLLAACANDRHPDQAPKPAAALTATTPRANQPAGGRAGCLACHPYPEKPHADLDCSGCHGGNPQAKSQAAAHVGLVAAPGAPAHLQTICGPCHGRQTEAIAASRHFTLSGEINPVRRHFGASQDLASAQDIPPASRPDTPLALADDLLRRRCLGCHLASRGDDFAATRHGTGCAACHLEYDNGKLVSHRFLAAPGDRQCRACHYGNRVGADYYGLTPHDLRQDYRTPFLADGSAPDRPYGLEQHRLQVDVHQRGGLLCLDCHSGLHQGAATTISCAACHLWRPGHPLPAASLRAAKGGLMLRLRADQQWRPVPPARDPAHARAAKIDCAVCHAQWGFNDQGTHLLRSDREDYQNWEDLLVQGNEEAETQLLNSLYGNGAVPPTMTDKLTGQSRPGLWLMLFAQRRWEGPLLGRDIHGRLRVMRPSLDLHLSWVDATGRTVFDAVSGPGPGLRPYTPHTIGKAGAFYRQRLAQTPPTLHPVGK